MRETWYVMEDGSVGDPRAIAPDKDGMLVHKDGRKVAYAPHGPRSRSVDVSANPSGGKKGGAAKPKPAEEAPAEVATDEGSSKVTSDMEAEQPAPARRGKPYKAREDKAD